MAGQDAEQTRRREFGRLDRARRDIHAQEQLIGQVVRPRHDRLDARQVQRNQVPAGGRRAEERRRIGKRGWRDGTNQAFVTQHGEAAQLDDRLVDGSQLSPGDHLGDRRGRARTCAGFDRHFAGVEDDHVGPAGVLGGVQGGVGLCIELAARQCGIGNGRHAGREGDRPMALFWEWRLQCTRQ